MWLNPYASIWTFPKDLFGNRGSIQTGTGSQSFDWRHNNNDDDYDNDIVNQQENMPKYQHILINNRQNNKIT